MQKVKWCILKSKDNFILKVGAIDLKNNKIFIVCVVMFLLLMTGCSNSNKIEGSKIVVEKQTNEVSKYEPYAEIKDNKEVQAAKDILNSIKWENAKVDMPHPPEFTFHFEDTNSKKVGFGYMLWISPNKDRISLVVDSESKYIQLDKEKSEKLFKILTGKDLSKN